MKTYETKGTFVKKGEKHSFTTTINAENDKLAKQKILSQMGSKQRLARVNIVIESIKEAK